jgi:hypothetical protein
LSATIFEDRRDNTLSNQVVTYIDMGLNSVDEYWQNIVVPGVQKFRDAATPSSVFHAAHSVWHLHDWVWHERNPGQNSRGATFDAYRSKLLADCPQLGWLRDVADAGKHRGLGRLPEVQGAHPQVIGGASIIGGGLVGGGMRVFFLSLNDGSLQNVDTVLRTAIAFWSTELGAKNLSSPFV